MVIAQGDIWWATLAAPTGSEAGFRRPVIVVQSDPLNRSRLATVVCVPLTRSLRWAEMPGNVRLAAHALQLPHDSVAQAALILAIDRAQLTAHVGRLSPAKLALVLAAIDVVLGRDR